jgi:hypothetical protein
VLDRDETEVHAMEWFLIVLAMLLISLWAGINTGVIETLQRIDTPVAYSLIKMVAVSVVSMIAVLAITIYLGVNGVHI